MLTLHKPDSVFSLRHVPSWLMLCFAAGAVNATSMLACSRFVTHVTGTVTRIGAEIAHLNLMLDFGLVLAWFIAGAFAAGLILHGSFYRGKTPPFSLPLWAASSITALVALMGHIGWLGPFGGEVDQFGDFLHLCALGFAMGMQNAAVATSTGQLVRTTHLTGPATDLGIHLADLVVGDSSARDLARRHALLRTGKLLSYAVGAATATALCAKLAYLTLLVPALVIAIANGLSFRPFVNYSSPPPVKSSRYPTPRTVSK
jgi:uncharacterized membrane protein YoaK (UPF0700 family)